jgi:hypothetical protein
MINFKEWNSSVNNLYVSENNAVPSIIKPFTQFGVGGRLLRYLK